MGNKTAEIDPWGFAQKEMWRKGFKKKDEDRVHALVNKANDDRSKEIALARRMAKSITGYAKAFQRYMAAETWNYHDVAEIFYDRAYDIFSSTGRMAAQRTYMKKTMAERVAARHLQAADIRKIISQVFIPLVPFVKNWDACLKKLAWYFSTGELVRDNKPGDLFWATGDAVIEMYDDMYVEEEMDDYGTVNFGTAPSVLEVTMPTGFHYKDIAEEWMRMMGSQIKDRRGFMRAIIDLFNNQRANTLIRKMLLDGSTRAVKQFLESAEMIEMIGYEDLMYEGLSYSPDLEYGVYSPKIIKKITKPSGNGFDMEIVARVNVEITVTGWDSSGYADSQWDGEPDDPNEKWDNYYRGAKQVAARRTSPKQ